MSYFIYEFIQKIKDMVASGEFFENATPLDVEDLMDGVDPLEIEEIVSEMNKPRTLQ